ncbi:aldose 1-epimerase family protein [uncultured Tenacibaculum sp.]|uniref:aldose 1-epimerase family protein n=1 Tax=uncultured Tenacibaculum sp. TaxID=174713 RepID=UPI00260A002E|nr:aldose 1-epimerase family protein [uncultured Tenacibaculum sp.]
MILENEQLHIELKTAGAELTKIYSKTTQLNYLWNGDEKFWKRHAPILFPIVGKLKEHAYYVDSYKFNLPQHGFARDNDFTVVSSTSNSVTFELRFSEKTLEIYPYKFKLRVSYTLIENTIKIEYQVNNEDDKAIYFSIGAHPAFSCPITSDGAFSDYYVEFEKNEQPEQYFLNQENGLRKATPSKRSIGNKLDLNYDLFADDALIFKHIQSNKISLKSVKHNHGLEFLSSDWEYFAFWTKKDAPFICFEPWMGAADLETTDQDFTTKDGIIELVKNNTFTQEYTIRFF